MKTEDNVWERGMGELAEEIRAQRGEGRREGPKRLDLGSPAGVIEGV